MALPFRSRFVYGTSTLEMSLPITPWNFTVEKVGGDIEADSGMRAAFIVCNNEFLSFFLRFTEEEWPDVQAFVDAAQAGGEVVWYPDQDEDAAHVCYLESPAVGTQYAAQPDSDYPRVLTLLITLVRPNCTPWVLPPYIDRTPTDEEPPPAPLPPPGWVIHIFENVFTDNLVVISGTGQAYVLIVGGGGSGGSVDGFGVCGGGGGGGEVIVMPDVIHDLDYLTLVPGTYPISVGEGGNAPHADHTIPGFGAFAGVSGGNTTFAGFTAHGGGGGGGADITIQRRGKDGGSGGGGASSGDAGPFDGGASTADDGYGNDGGDGTNSGSAVGAGGGGASLVGSLGTGGAGLLHDISNVDEIDVEYGRGGDSRNGGPGRFTGGYTGHGGEGGGQALMSDGADGEGGCVIVKYRMETGIIAIGGTRTEYPD